MEKPVQYKYARYEYQKFWDWISEREPELAGWWDMSFFAIQTRMTWGEQKEDILVVLKNKNEERRSIAYKLVELEHACDTDETRV